MKFNEYIKQYRLKYFKNLEKFCKIIGVENPDSLSIHEKGYAQERKPGKRTRKMISK